MKIKYCLLFTIIYLTISCKLKNNKIINSISERVTIIVNNNDKTITNIGSGIDINSFDRVNINTSKKTDTIHLNIKTYLKLYIRNDYFFKNVICKKGDTLVLNISKTDLNIYFSNRNLKKFDTISLNDSYKLNLQNYIYKHNTLFNKFMTIDNNKVKPKIYVIKSNLYEFRKLNKSYELKLGIKKLTLDKLKNKQLISYPNYYSELSQLDFKYFNSLIKNYRLSLDKYYLQKIKKYFFKKKLVFDDPFISYGYLNSYVKNIILNNEKSRTVIDYEKAYNLLPNFLENKNLKLLREFCLHQMAQQKDNINEILKYFNYYKEKYPNNNFIKLFKEKYLLNSKKESLVSNSVQLIQYNSNKISLEKVIKSHKKKLIYIDFWASWCIPCRLEMEKSKKIQAKLKNKDIDFIYISIDTDKNKWIKASKEEGMFEKNNYLALNYPVANFYSELELNTIPRYILYDKKGNIILENAPRPSNNKLEKLILYYLNN
jgi:thiol-disulfide isomerase/thioredoxin